MGFFIQVCAIFVLGFVNAWLYARKLRRRRKDWSAFLLIFTVAGMWAWGGLIYLDVIPIGALVNWLPWVNVTDGKTWMWNALLLFGINLGVTYQPGLNPMAAIIFLSYPCFYWIANIIGKYVYGTRTYEGGLWWALSPLKKPRVATQKAQ
ncbi:MAG: hypothetical protein ACTSU5_12570 [Promethearchaeota archaeon]